MTKITFLGTGTSQGVPVISCGCWVCSSDDPRDKRLRSSVLVSHNGTDIVIDAGPDFRQQMLREDIRSIDAILLTHEHKDHIAGMDDVRAYNYTTGKPVKVYATERVQHTVRKDFDYAFEEDKYPGVPEIDLNTIEPQTPFFIDETQVVPVEGLHHKLPVLGFRIGDIAYLTDLNHIGESELEKIRNVDILIINALRHEHHLSHFSLSEALHIRYLVNPRYTYFTHVSHQMGRYSQVSKELPENTFFAYDGLMVESYGR